MMRKRIIGRRPRPWKEVQLDVQRDARQLMAVGIGCMLIAGALAIWSQR